MVDEDTLRAHQAYYPGDRTEWQRTSRLLQSLWRERKGLASSGPEPHAGSSLDTESGTEETGAAFISADAIAAARKGVSERQRGAVIQKDRLYRNLLSSQPLCFNLFGRLSEHLDDPRVVEAIRALFPDVATLDAIRYEQSPGRGDARFLENGTAFDVLIDYRDVDGAARFVGIEVKYHEDLGGTEPAIRERAREIFRTSGAFAEGSEDELTEGRTAQLLLDHLLALSMNADSDCATGRFVLLYPTRNDAVADVAATYERQLTPTGRATFATLTLERIIDAWDPIFGGEPWLTELRDRYVGPPDTGTPTRMAGRD